MTKPTCYEWCMNTTDAIVKLLGPKERTLPEGLHLCCTVSNSKQLCVILLAVPESVVSRWSESVSSSSKSSAMISAFIWPFRSFKGIFWSPWSERGTAQSMSSHCYVLLKISVLLQPETCQFRWPASRWHVLILRFVMPFGQGSRTK